MKFLILLSFLVYGCVAKGKKGKKGIVKRQLNGISNELSELQSGQQQLGDKLEEQLGGVLKEYSDQVDERIGNFEERIGNEISELKDLISNGLEKLGEKIKCEKRGVWNLGMNINPADGHTFGYTVGWSTGAAIGSNDAALTKDYLNAKTWVLPANYIAIVRHQQGVVDAVKVFKFKTSGESLKTRFGLKNMNPGRQIVTSGGPIQESIADDADNMEDDPIFSVGGDLAFNWAYSDNGCRIALTGGHLSAANVNDDNTHGLGNDFAVDPLTGDHSSKKSLHDYWGTWEHDIANIQNSPIQTPCTVQGTDRGTGKKLISGPVYGNYAIYVSSDAEKFPEPGNKLSLQIEV